ncbi:hypothetical protein HDU83_008370 [Entophlyctis luteolus]|nr:hypothetical protein HDU83_008370 [Entophlyctis luteolus]
MPTAALFTDAQNRPLRFTVTRSDDRASIRTLIEQNGGVVVDPHEQDIYMRISNPKLARMDGATFYSSRYIVDAVRAGALPEDREHYRLWKDSAAGDPFAASPMKRSSRTPFSKEDDAELIRILVDNTRNLGGNALYQELANKNRRHTMHSWRDRAVKVLLPQLTKSGQLDRMRAEARELDRTARMTMPDEAASGPDHGVQRNSPAREKTSKLPKRNLITERMASTTAAYLPPESASPRKRITRTERESLQRGRSLSPKDSISNINAPEAKRLKMFSSHIPPAPLSQKQLQFYGLSPSAKTHQQQQQQQADNPSPVFSPSKTLLSILKEQHQKSDDRKLALSASRSPSRVWLENASPKPVGDASVKADRPAPDRGGDWLFEESVGEGADDIGNRSKPGLDGPRTPTPIVGAVDGVGSSRSFQGRVSPSFSQRLAAIAPRNGVSRERNMPSLDRSPNAPVPSKHDSDGAGLKKISPLAHSALVHQHLGHGVRNPVLQAFMKHNGMGVLQHGASGKAGAETAQNDDNTVEEQGKKRRRSGVEVLMEVLMESRKREEETNVERRLSGGLQRDSDIGWKDDLPQPSVRQQKRVSVNPSPFVEFNVGSEGLNTKNGKQASGGLVASTLQKNTQLKARFDSDSTESKTPVFVELSESDGDEDDALPEVKFANFTSAYDVSQPAAAVPEKKSRRNSDVAAPEDDVSKEVSWRVTETYARLMDDFKVSYVEGLERRARQVLEARFDRSKMDSGLLLWIFTKDDDEVLLGEDENSMKELVNRKGELLVNARRKFLLSLEETSDYGDDV